MKINFVLIISFLCAVLVVNNVNAQNKFVLKGGPTFGVSTTNYWGAGLGVERQIGRRTAFAATVEYLTSKIPTDAEFLVMVNSNSFWRSNYVPTSIGVNGEFRFYFKNNPLTSLEGFYMGLGIEVGQLTATELRVNFQSGQPYTKLKTPITESLTYGGPNLSLGGVVPIGDNLSLEFSGGLKLNFADRNRGQAFMPITARIRYSFLKKIKIMNAPKMMADDDGTLVILSKTLTYNATNPNGICEITIRKMDSNFNVLWNKKLADWCTDMSNLVKIGGDYYFTLPSSTGVIALYKVNPNGESTLVKSYGSNNGSIILLKTQDNNLLMVSKNLVKVSTTGTEIWKKTLSDTYVSDAKNCLDGGFVIVARNDPNAQGLPTIEIYNLQGQQLKRYEEVSKVNISDLPQGCYLFLVKSGEKQQKVMIEKL